MSDSISSHVSTQGPVHAGPGPQNIYYSISLADPRGRSPRRQAADDLLWLEQRFVHPAGFGKARDILELHRTVFLDAPPGNGRITTAKMLLWELRPDAEKFHELLSQDTENEPRLNLGHIGDGDRAWLDLSDVSGPLWSEIHAELPSLRRAVQEHAAHLVIVLPHAIEDLRPELNPYRAQIVRSPTREVLHRYLRMENIPQPEPLPELQFLGENRPLRDIPKYVRLITDAREKVSGKTDFATWCDTAYQALSDQGKEVAELVATLSRGPQRALLLATSMLHGAHADSILHAAASFLRTVEYPPDECPMLERATLGQRLEEISAELDGFGCVRFSKLGYDSAVRAYFWTHLPELRDHMEAWVGSTANSDLTDDEREGLVRRFTEQCLNDRYQSTWTSLVERWTIEPSTDHKMKAAALVLQRGLRDEKQGRAFRRKIYDWSRSSNLPDPLAEVIVAACRDEMTVTHPDEALVRLHHVARRERRTRRARDALVGLVSGDRRFLRQMLNRLTDTYSEGRMWVADADLFLDLADPEALADPGTRNHALISESTIPGQLAGCWSLVFTERSHETWSARAEQWLYYAAADRRHRHVLLDVLVQGGEQRTAVLARLYAMTRGQELRAAISDLLLQKINAALDVQPT